MGIHHLHDSKNDDVEESGKTFDQRSQERRQRESIAINPAGTSNSIDSAAADLDPVKPSNTEPVKPTTTDAADSSKSGVAGTIAAAGVGAAGVAAAAASTLSKGSQKDSAKKLATKTVLRPTLNLGKMPRQTLHILMILKSPVSGFAATTSAVNKDGQNTATDSENNPLWTPDSANRDKDGNLRYASDGTSTAAVGRKKSGGWFHWLWWPVLIFGSLLAAGIYFQDEIKEQMAARDKHIKSKTVDPTATAQDEDEIDSSESGGYFSLRDQAQLPTMRAPMKTPPIRIRMVLKLKLLQALQTHLMKPLIPMNPPTNRLQT